LFQIIKMKISLFVVLLFLLSCSKKDNSQNGQKKCYTIIFGKSIGGTACERKSPLDTCIDPLVNISSLKFVDKCNNDISWTVR
jgi:hypothetical protein